MQNIELKIWHHTDEFKISFCILTEMLLDAKVQASVGFA